MNKIPSDQLLFEVEDVLRTMPPAQSLGNDDFEVLAWLGRASAAVHAWDPLKAVALFDSHVGRLSSAGARDFNSAMRGVLVMLHQARNDLRMKTTGPLSVGVVKGSVFEYFDEIRRVIEVARSDLLFVDPFLDAEFTSRYLPFVASGTSVRLLGREKIPGLVAAVGLFAAQHGLSITVRSSGGLHDRYILVDGVACYQSGASFKDGAKKAGTTLTQITDAFVGVRDTYEALWAAGTVHV
ncbi:hypothetical protein [Rhodoferax saidenbachensis]|uniref:Uncharacterized protein n=1 Tax=Rhodoferax saidenbachensis TaxID=1484693 RepID=A0A1P8K802_9BURK|nr:hypothetical protein [Rhodoferax saidenbachensis]APW42111.1 hypothetical protein RS694_05905 [Rhodoferax saidenbachensis]